MYKRQDYTSLEDDLETAFSEFSPAPAQDGDYTAYIASVADFIARIWQIHPFAEGNTRTVAVFLQQLLHFHGFPQDCSEAFDLSLIHIYALWATFTYKRGSQQARRRFHTFSTVVWLAWLVPYIIGMLVGIPAIHLQAVCAIGTSVIIVAILAVILFAKGCKKNDRGGKRRGTSPHAISH